MHSSEDPAYINTFFLKKCSKCEKWKVKMLVTQWCPTFCDPMDYSPPGSSICGILQARILEWVVIPFSRNWTQVSCIAGRFFTVWATREALVVRLGEHKCRILEMHLKLKDKQLKIICLYILYTEYIADLRICQPPYLHDPILISLSIYIHPNGFISLENPD